MTPEERRAGVKRLGLITLGLGGAAFLAALVFAGLGAAGAQALAGGCGLVGVALVVAGVVVFGRTGPVRRTAGVYQRASVEERKEAEHLALGLFGFGIVFSVLALVLG
jgi:hypothetical protein